MNPFIYEPGACFLETAQQLERRAAIVRILRDQAVGRQADLVRLLRRSGHEATQSSVSRDLRELGVLKAGDRYVLRTGLESGEGEFGALAGFVREIRPAGSSITVVKTATGAAQSVALAVDRAQWPEVVGTISGDDTIFIATDGAPQQQKVLQRLHSAFRV
jgi:transcriptional regulator of arginine metabolism